jgi:VIT1/CCC1 family predicted Fe2+/Mn2+ transporter
MVFFAASSLSFVVFVNNSHFVASDAISYTFMEKSYIGDIVLGASDGLVTTFAIVSGVAGANLTPNVIIILGAAKLLADGVSMAAGNYLGHESEEEALGRRRLHTPQMSALLTFLAFIGAGIVPLLPYLIIGSGQLTFYTAILLTLVTLFIVGAGRTYITKRPWITSGFEMLLIGSVAASVAYVVGYLLKPVAVNY